MQEVIQELHKTEMCIDISLHVNTHTVPECSILAHRVRLSDGKKRFEVLVTDTYVCTCFGLRWRCHTSIPPYCTTVPPSLDHMFSKVYCIDSTLLYMHPVQRVVVHTHRLLLVVYYHRGSMAVHGMVILTTRHVV